MSLSHNELVGPIPSDWQQCKQLKVLDLSSNRFHGNIPTHIANLTMLQELYLQENLLTGTLPFNFGSGLPNLIRLSLAGNELSGRIPSSISNASKLTHLKLARNQFSGTIPHTLGDLRYLERLYIQHNRLIAKDASDSEPSFLSSLTNCRNLKFLHFSNNPLQMKLSKSIGNLSDSLLKLEAGSCGIHGNIPLEIGNLSHLYMLSLSRNDLSGPIPATIGNLQDLQVLTLQDNELHGSINDRLCEVIKLGYLYLGGNKFSGEMPPCLGNLTTLRELYLDSNKLMSQIPYSFWNLKDILKLNLSSNTLVGNLPLEIKNLRSVTLLDLSRNQITGSIPKSFGSLLTLQNLSLAANQMQGSIPESLGNMVNLEFLDLSQNDFSGGIPQSLESLVHLRFLNLSCNRLYGEIPSGGVFRNLTAESFMKNEGLCGSPQLKVPACKKRTSTAKQVSLRYILPTLLVATILVVSIIILLRNKRRNSNVLVQKDLSTLGAPRRISYCELLQATNGFDESNLLGRGSFGSVFKGKLSSGMMVAIKVFNFDSEIMSRSFEVECDAMRNLRHRNLVKVISSCSNVDFKSLIMEFMPNGSLEKWLYSHNYCLDFLQRLNLMIDVACAMEYLHHGLSTTIVHCDLKPSNILLDDDMVGHVGDFGISKLLDEGQSKTHTETLATVGYIAPEYGSSGIVSTKADVYSYGIILMEVFTRKKPTEDMFGSGMSLKSWVSESMPNEIMQVIDSNLLLEGDEQHTGKIMACTSSIFELALNCCTNYPENRTNMIDVVVSLQKIRAMFIQRQRRSNMH